MSKPIKTWDELYKLRPTKRYKIVEEPDFGAWIKPVQETEGTQGQLWPHHHVYLHSHIFYGEYCKKASETLQRFGFDVEIVSWDGEDIKRELIEEKVNKRKNNYGKGKKRKK